MIDKTDTRVLEFRRTHVILYDGLGKKRETEIHEGTQREGMRSANFERGRECIMKSHDPFGRSPQRACPGGRGGNKIETGRKWKFSGCGLTPMHGAVLDAVARNKNSRCTTEAQPKLLYSVNSKFQGKLAAHNSAKEL